MADIKRCFICDYAEQDNTSKDMPLEEIIGELCRWIEVNHWGLGIEFYHENGGSYVEIMLARSLSFTNAFIKKKSFYIPCGNITKEHFSFVKDRVKKWIVRMNYEYKKAYIKEHGHEPING